MAEKAHHKFMQEASELIDDLEQSVLELEKERGNAAHIEQIFRVMHTFKGTAKMFGFDKIGEFTHYLENIYDELRAEKITLSEGILEVTFQSVDHIRNLLHQPAELAHAIEQQHAQLLEKVIHLSGAATGIETSHKAKKHAAQLYYIHFAPAPHFIKTGNNPLFLLEDLLRHGEYHMHTRTENIPSVDQYQADTTYLAWDILLYTSSSASELEDEFMFVMDDCSLQITALGTQNLLQNGAFLHDLKKAGSFTEKTILSLQAARTSPETATPAKTHKAKSASGNHVIKVTYEKIDNLMGLVSELVTTQARLSLYTDQHKTSELEEIAENVEKLVRQLRDEAFSISLLPVSHLKMRFERLVRDTAKDLHKKVHFISEGDDTELDKKIIEALTDPLLHILRNSLGHGLELPAERLAKGKPEFGTLLLKSYTSGAHVVIEVHDDGAGIDPTRVKQKAIEKGLIEPHAELSEKEIYNLIFLPGFSTAQAITDVSGRGVGMDVVKKAVVDLRGDIQIESTLGKGTIMRLILPLSLSIIDGLLVQLDNHQYIIPLSSIEKCYEVAADSITPDMNGLIVLDAEQIPLIDLRKVFDLAPSEKERTNLIVSRFGNQKLAIQVDDIVDEYQAVIKPLGGMYKHQDFASGASILGNGRVALVLDVSRLGELVA
ncbi:chemotaxis protein CheA [Cytophagales bacterium LB-30]|uniref:Chemotaxis protein CheA n=1 Tax=Shiella aurantiaca TaxID=3058365 RepID=A0ABT8F6N3_9BACT|nr:chemotaxis protein CheA [Shiella aurantiaca]MDN4166125.1 chemotaxis protein CheA [Shiella aurantiaca]